MAPFLLESKGVSERSDEIPRDVIVLEAFPSWGIIATLRSGRFKWVAMDEARVYFAWTRILGQIWRSLSSIPKSGAGS